MNKGIYTVIGLGKTGFSCVEYLLDQQLNVFVCDTRENPPHLDSARKLLSDDQIRLGKIDQDFLERSDVIVLSPGVSRAEPEIALQIQKGKPVIGDVELFCQRVNAPIVGITGTNGKSSVTALVGEMARCAGVDVNVGGNIGTPVLDFISMPEPELYVLELSSFQLESTNSLCAEVAVILNLTPDHLDQHGTFENYKKAKHRIFNHCKNVVINLDDEGTFPSSRHSERVHERENPESFSLAGSSRIFNNEIASDFLENTQDDGRVNCLKYSIKQKADFHLKKINNELFLCQNDSPVISTNELKIKGKHQYSNALAALCIGSLIDLPIDAMCKALREFEGLPHRCQLVSSHKGVLWFNDSKATTVDAAIASIKSVATEISGKIILLAGGQGKQQDFSSLKNTTKYLKKVILFGEDSHILEDVFKGAAEVFQVSNLESAVNMADDLAESGDAVLLAPACASFDMFKNFEHRGECFTELVRKLS